MHPGKGSLRCLGSVSDLCKRTFTCCSKKDPLCGEKGKGHEGSHTNSTACSGDCIKPGTSNPVLSNFGVGSTFPGDGSRSAAFPLRTYHCPQLLLEVRILVFLIHHQANNPKETLTDSRRLSESHHLPLGTNVATRSSECWILWMLPLVLSKLGGSSCPG